MGKPIRRVVAVPAHEGKGIRSGAVRSQQGLLQQNA